ncbi:unnamed protein product [Arabidopsis halleri]
MTQVLTLIKQNLNKLYLQFCFWSRFSSNLKVFNIVHHHHHPHVNGPSIVRLIIICPQ